MLLDYAQVLSFDTSAGTGEAKWGRKFPDLNTNLGMYTYSNYAGMTMADDGIYLVLSNSVSLLKPLIVPYLDFIKLDFYTGDIKFWKQVRMSNVFTFESGFT